MQSMVEMHRAQFTRDSTGAESGGGEQQTAGDNTTASATTRTIAAGLVVKSGSDLVLAACLKLSRQNKDQYSRKEILDAMKEATGYLAPFNAETLRRDSKWKPAKTTDDLGLLKESELLNVLAAISVIGKNIKQELEGCLTLRNGCGHANTMKLGEAKVAAHVETRVLNVFSQF
jgi:hypothetical protein